MGTKKIKRNVTVDWIKAIACFVVVLQHCLSHLIHKLSVEFPIINGLYFFSSKINVPLFFIVSGFLLYQQPIKQYLRKKIPKIIIPFFTFTSLKIIYSFIGGEFAHGSTVTSQLYEAFVVGDLYWFSYAIMLMFLVVPLLWKTKTVGRDEKKHELPVAGIICFVAVVLFNILNERFGLISLPRVLETERTLKYFPFFLMGYIIKFIYPVLKQAGKWIVAACAIASVPLNYYFYVRRPENLNYLWWLGTAMLLCLDIWIMTKPIKRIPKALKLVSKYTYQVFFLDSFVKIIIFTAIGKLIGNGIYKNLGLCLTVVIAEVFADVAVSVLISSIAQKIPMVNILFGLTDLKSKQSQNR